MQPCTRAVAGLIIGAYDDTLAAVLWLVELHYISLLPKAFQVFVNIFLTHDGAVRKYGSVEYLSLAAFTLVIESTL